MFGQPVLVTDKLAIFHLVWTYVIKELNSQKKTRCVCNGSPRSGQVRILDHTYANCIDLTELQFYYAISATKNMLIYRPNISNVFEEAPPPKQGFYIYPECALKNGGLYTKGIHQSRTATLFPPLVPCKAIPNPHICGKSTLTRSYTILALPSQSMNPAYTLDWSSTNVSSLCTKLTILLFQPHQHALQTTFY
jgi:hypothetical protein